MLGTQGFHTHRCECFSILSARYNALIELKSTGQYLTGTVFKHKNNNTGMMLLPIVLISKLLLANLSPQDLSHSMEITDD